MPADEMKRAKRETLARDLFLAIGSSLVVYPAAGLPGLAKESGSTLALKARASVWRPGLEWRQHRDAAAWRDVPAPTPGQAAPVPLRQESALTAPPANG